MTSHMTPEEFRRRGYQTIDWIARYLERLEEFPVMSRVEPGEIRRQLPAAAPEGIFSPVLPLHRNSWPGIPIAMSCSSAQANLLKPQFCLS